MDMNVLWQMCQNGHGEYARCAVLGRMIEIGNGDVNFDVDMMDSFLRLMLKDHQVLNNPDFYEVVKIFLTYTHEFFDGVEMEKHGATPLGFSAETLQSISEYLNEVFCDNDRLLFILDNLVRDLLIYEKDYSKWQKEPSGYDFDQRDFIDYDRANRLR